MAAVTPTARGGIATWKQNSVRLIKTIVLLLVFLMRYTNAFDVHLIHAKSLRTILSSAKIIDNSRTGFNDSIFSGGSRVLQKAATVDQEQDEDHRRFSNTIHRTNTDCINLPKNDIDWVAIGYLNRLEECYIYSERQIKCPFFRRRCGDILDDVESFVRFFLIRPYFKDSSSHLGPVMSCKPLAGVGTKTKHLPVGQVLNVLRQDWKAPKNCQADLELYGDLNSTTATVINEKGYYATGRMSTQIYRDDCEFSSPDPDLPLKGIRKYIGIASNLFDSRTSRSKLLSLKELRPEDETQTGANVVLKAEWKISLTINLPWRPQLSEFSGSTLYCLDRDNLIYRHQEVWDISAFDAFIGMLTIPKMHNKNLRCPLSLFSSWNT